MQGTVWTAGNCHSWYLDDTGRNTTLWPVYTSSSAVVRGSSIPPTTCLKRVRVSQRVILTGGASAI